MLRFSANLGFLWPERPILDRIAAARAAGFRYVEMHWPYEVEAVEIDQALKRNRLTNLAFNAPAGDREAGELGLGAVKGREAEFQAGIDQAIEYCLTTGTQTIHALAGVVPPNQLVEAKDVLVENLRNAARRTEREGLTIVLEPINQRDKPGYFYSSTAKVVEIIDAVGAQNLRLLFDVYHAQINEGDILTRLKAHLPLIHHIQIAAVPSRAEPDEGEVNYRAVFDCLETLGYEGAIGCEYKPRSDTDAGLKHWMSALDVDMVKESGA
ncbi:MAG: Hydroxypyruvate isomerase [Microvirga sp.]|nr:Hydroxypyruvate isomerase [Microvirga sp.]